MRISYSSLTISFLTLFVFMISCQKQDPAPASPSVTIDGQPITFTTTKATSTGSGLEIVLADNASKITLTLSGTTADNYTVQNRTGRVATSSTAIITAVHNSKLYYGTGGTVVIKMNNGTLSIETSELTLKAWSKETVKLSGMNVTGMKIGQVPDGCRISSYAYAVEGLRDCYHDANYSFSYNAEGKISRAYGPEGELFFTYGPDGKLLGYSGFSVAPGGAILEGLELSYSDSTLTSFSFMEAPSSDSVNTIYRPITTYTLSYTDSKLTGASVSYSTSNSINDSYSKTISYEGNNVNHILSSYEGGATNDNKYYASFDNYKNPYSLLAKLMASKISFLSGGFDNDFDLFGLDTNNVLSRTIWAGQETFEYTYGTHGYPTQIIYTPNNQEYCTGTVTITISYDGC